MRSLSRTPIIAAAAIAAATLILTGCTTSTPETPATGDAIDVSAYTEATTAALAGPTSWQGPTESVTPPEDITLAIITCASVLQGCLAPAEAAAQAAGDLGWDATVYDGKGDPATQNQLILQAISSGADAILTFSIDPSFVATALQAAHEAGIPVGSGQQGVAPSEDGFAFDVGANWIDVGTIQGNWIVSSSGGTATLLPMIDREYGSVVASAETASDLVRGCASCTVLPYEEFVGANVGAGLGTRVAGLVRQNPAIGYILGTYDPAAADIATGLGNAGLTGQAKVIGQIGIAQSFELIRSGKQAATVAFDELYSGYAAVDQMARLLAGVPLVKTAGLDEAYAYGENVPIKLVTSENIADIPGDAYEADIDTVANFHRLWGIDD